MAKSRTVGCRALLLSILIVAGFADVGESNITIRPRSASDVFFFHANYSQVPFLPSDAFGIQIWNCSGGERPVFIPDREPLVVCDWDADTGYRLADLVYSVELPSDTCIDHGRSCYFRDSGVPSRADGIRLLRIQYARRGHGNRVWLESYGDLSRADQAEMMIVITINGRPRAVLEETFTPLPNGGWFSPF